MAFKESKKQKNLKDLKKRKNQKGLKESKILCFFLFK